MNLAKYQKIEVALFGVITPSLLLMYTSILLSSGQAVFWGRSATIIYHSDEAYFVSLLWFGVCGCMYNCFLLRPLKLLSYSTRKWLLYSSFTLLCLGLLSAIVLV